LS
ncbi:Late transcription factor VLTF-4 (1), partial [Monkeypox virus]|jgi:hypothetical protein